MDFSTLRPFGWKPFFQQQLALEELETPELLQPLRVSQVQRSELRALGSTGELRIAYPHAARWSEQVTVGDWIVARASGDQWYLERVLERQNGLLRVAAGDHVVPQWLGANLDFVFIVMPCDDGFNLNRLERFLAVALDGGVDPVVVLTKADLTAPPDPLAAAPAGHGADTFLDQIPAGYPRHALDARDPDAVAELVKYAPAGHTVAFIGASGVGKSTLINSLVGSAVMATSEVRASDGKGRHTTTFRQLLMLPNGGLVIDTPGMRELQLPGVDEGLETLFDDIDALAAGCRFRDCAHAQEPGCRVQAALASGELEARRWNNYLKMLREQAYHDRELQARHVVAEQRRRHIRMLEGSARAKAQLRDTSLD